MAGKFHLLVDDLQEYAVGVAAGEGNLPVQQFEIQHSHGSHVNFKAVFFLLQHLRSEVLGSAAHGPGPPTSHHFGDAEIDQADVAALVEENILWLDVSVDDIALVQIVEREEDLQ